MKKHIVKIVLVVVIALGIYCAYDYYGKQFKESYTYSVVHNDELVGFLHLSYLNNNDVSKIRISTIYNDYSLEFVDEDELIEKSDEILQVARDDSFSLNYDFSLLPYHHILKQEMIYIDLDDMSLSDHNDILTYLGLAKYVNKDHLKVTIDDLKNDEDFFYRWIIDNGELSYVE